ncbi:MAG: hypothetical protein IKS83_09175, partial [Victivallales bacterium]|nr:hypothetical protein [Victivallales bacterium]
MTIVALVLLFGATLFGQSDVRQPPATQESPAEIVEESKGLRPLSADEEAALRWLDHIAGPLPEAEEKEWWNIGGRQFGLFATRYNIAFAGYAAAALGMRGNPEQKAAVGRILD